MSSPSAFNLIDEPWIKVRARHGAVEERSLRSVFADSAELRGLAGEIPTQDAAVLRLLLAVLLGATRPRYPRSDSECLDLWSDWWSRGSFPMDVIDPYLERHRDRFDLLHLTTPFYQVAGLTTASGNSSGLGKLIGDLPANLPFFSTRGGAEAQALSLPEAARWLVHCQAFDPSGIKTGAVGDDRVKGGRGYPFGYPAWAGNLGLVLAEGESLFETLWFNVPLTKSGPDDLSAWERPPVGPGIDATHPLPLGPADLFTWPSRRLRLIVNAGRAIDVQISNGDKLGPQNLHPFEPMSGWRHSKAQSKKGDDVQMPVTHDPGRRVWQGLDSLLLGASGGQARKPAEVIEWLGRLRYDELLPSDHLVDLRIVGIQYGTQNSVIVGAVDDRLTASVAALTHPVLVQAAVDAASQASKGVVALANLAGNLDRAAGGDGKARERTFELGYSLLDGAFRGWIRTLDDPAQVASRREAWAASARAVLRRAGGDIVADAGPAALVGRQVSQLGSDQKALLDAGLAQIWFNAALAKTFPLPDSRPTEVKQ